MKHVPVLLEEVIEGLAIKENGIYIDGTVGYGGHSEEIAKRLGEKGKLIGFDRDEDALAHTTERLKNYTQVQLIHDSYHNALDHISEEVDGILLDLGASSPQFDQPERGFAFKSNGALDMRFDISGTKITAADIVNTYQEKELAHILKAYGEERFASKIAKAVCERRKDLPFATTKDLADFVEDVIPKRFWPKSIHPATKTFQALRIAVNEELDIIKDAIPKLIAMLKPGGRIAIISFHSLEDRLVKQAFREAEKSCICPKEFPVCRCDKEQMIRVITKKPISATKTQIKNNVRSRSAKLRLAERI